MQYNPMYVGHYAPAKYPGSVYRRWAKAIVFAWILALLAFFFVNPLVGVLLFAVLWGIVHKAYRRAGGPVALHKRGDGTPVPVFGAPVLPWGVWKQAYNEDENSF